MTDPPLADGEVRGVPQVLEPQLLSEGSGFHSSAEKVEGFPGCVEGGRERPQSLGSL